MSTTDASTPDRERLVYLSKLAEQTERYDDMVGNMREVVQEFGALTYEERNLFSLAYKNLVGSRRTAWRVIVGIDAKAESGDKKYQVTKLYKVQVQKELEELCELVLSLIDQHLLADDTAESQVFYLKMKGDYYRYLAEVLDGEKKATVVDSAADAYSKATKRAEDGMPSTHPIRLGLALNYSVFYYEIKEDNEMARQLAKKAFEEAITKIDGLPEESYKDTTLIMQLLRDNLTLWTAEAQPGGQE